MFNIHDSQKLNSYTKVQLMKSRKDHSPTGKYSRAVSNNEVKMCSVLNPVARPLFSVQNLTENDSKTVFIK